jgi:FtsZ-binding cell division protein ZapB
VSRLQAHIGRLLDPVRAGQSDRIAGLEAEVERLREDYAAMRLEWSKSVDERDDALAEVKRLRDQSESWRQLAEANGAEAARRGGEVVRLREELRVADEDHEHDEKVLREATDALLKAYDQSGLVDLRWFVPYMEALRTARTPDTEGEQ